MKVLIWILCLIIYSLLDVMIKDSNIALNIAYVFFPNDLYERAVTAGIIAAVVSVALIWFTWRSAKFLCKKWDNRKKAAKNISKGKEAGAGNYRIMSEEVYLDPSNIGNGVEPKVNHSNYSPSVDPGNADVKADHTPTEIQAGTFAQLTCKKCGKEYNSSFAFCPYCGKKSRKKKRTFLIVSIFLILVCALAFFAHTAITKAKLEEIRNNAFEAIYNQDFSKAKYYLDQYPDAQSTFMSEYAYVQAGILLEEGHYLDALNEFKKLNYPVPASIMEGLEDKIYNLGIRSYRSKDYNLAERQFKAIAGYKRSNDYLTLTKAHLSYTTNNCSDLLKLLGFEDAQEIITNSSVYLEEFLIGKWKTESKSYSFEMDEDGDSRYTLPSKGSGKYYQLVNGKYQIGDKKYTDCFKFTIVDKNTIKVFCFKNNKTYKMYRQ